MTEPPERPIEVIRSDRRRKSVSAELKEGILIVRAPDTMDDETLQPIIAKLQKRLHKNQRLLDGPEYGRRK